jgi:hypothetical protein
VHPLVANEWARIGVRDGELTDRADRLPLRVEPVLQGPASESERVFQKESAASTPAGTVCRSPHWPNSAP